MEPYYPFSVLVIRVLSRERGVSNQGSNEFGIVSIWDKYIYCNSKNKNYFMVLPPSSLYGRRETDEGISGRILGP